MATAGDILTLRDYIGEPDETNGWTDEKLEGLIDASLTLNAAASSIWYSKAASYAGLVNVSESGSSRSLSDLFKNAQQMGAYYKGLDDVVAEVIGDVPVIMRIRRGFT